eukprot:TRINITY_DN9847_c0_g1_i2.p1 TRINITY_DN9847_c0_g1~~TRINITY_DN9847_c0_g1_i2.p1  ORF type:complete len:336 (-),score=77.15 TRINITY_DN9847_c0_g1_i2:264-1271(-)
MRWQSNAMTSAQQSSRANPNPSLISTSLTGPGQLLAVVDPQGQHLVAEYGTLLLPLNVVPTTPLTVMPSIPGADDTPPQTTHKRKSRQSTTNVNNDERELKRQKRLLQNRQSAALSRQRKKEYVGSIERKTVDLEGDNRQLKQQLYLTEQRLHELEQKYSIMLKQNDELKSVLRVSNKSDELNRILAQTYAALALQAATGSMSDARSILLDTQHLAAPSQRALKPATPNNTRPGVYHNLGRTTPQQQTQHITQLGGSALQGAIDLQGHSAQHAAQQALEQVQVFQHLQQQDAQDTDEQLSDDTFEEDGEDEVDSDSPVSTTTTPTTTTTTTTHSL